MIHSWLPAQGSGRSVVRALSIVIATMIHAQFALSFEGSLTMLPFEPGSTLDAYVSQQDFDLRKSVIDFVDSGVLLGRQAPKFHGPKLTAPTTTPTTTLSRKRSILKRRSTNLPTGKQPTDNHSAKTSPFRKWVKPQANTTDRQKADATTPQVARLLPKAPKALPATPLLLNPAKNAPRHDSKRSSAVASDLSTRNEIETIEPESTPPTPPAQESKKTQPPSLPTSAAETGPTAAPPRNLPPLTTSQINLRKKIRQVLTHYYNRPMNTRDRSPWELMHAMLAFEAHSKVLQGGPKGDPITAVGWLCYNQACKRRTLMYVGDEGDLRVRVGPALQGHRGQLLAMLAQSRINRNYPLLVEDHKLKVADLIEMEQRTCYPRTELTFKLIALMHYLDSDETWVNDQGMEWGIPRLISEELRQPVRGAACGGTHRLSGLTLAYKTREKRGEALDGQYLKAKHFVNRYQQYAYRLQNRDGSFSTEWFRGPGNEDDLDRKLKTTGHILEWLLYAAGEQELKHWKTTKATNYLATIMQRNRYKDWEAGPLGHAIHALLVYDRLVFSPYDAPGESSLATKMTPARRAKRNR